MNFMLGPVLASWQALTLYYLIGGGDSFVQGRVKDTTTDSII